MEKIPLINANEAGIQIPKDSFKDRLKLLWLIIKYLFKPEIYHNVHMKLDDYGRVMISGWMRKPGETEWKYHYVSYDGKTSPSGYVDGILIDVKNEDALKLIGREIEIEQIKDCRSSD